MKNRPINLCKFFLAVFICGVVITASSVVYAGVIIQPAPSSGLLSYWTFDAKTIDWGSNSISDISGNGNTGTMVSMTSGGNQIAGKRAQALFFDGNVDSISLASNPVTSVSNPSSVCSWANTNDISASTGGYNQTILNLYTNSNNGIHIGNVANSGSFFASYRSGGVYYGAQSTVQVFSNNTWVHVCYVWNGSGITLYANGVSIASTTNSDSAGTVNTIGAHNDLGDGAWSGSIDDLRIYNRALSLTEIKQIYQSGALVLNSLPNKTVVLQKTPSNFLSNGLVGYWSFDGSKINWATNRVTDSSGNGNTGTIINMSTTTSPSQGKMGQALSFDGINDFVSVGSTNADFERTDPFSFSLWSKWSGTTDNFYSFLGRSNGLAGTYFFWAGSALASLANANSIVFAIDGSNATALDVSTATNSVLGSTNAWTHIVVTYDGTSSVSGVKIYVNGTSMVLTTHQSDLSASIKPSVDWRIGDDYTNDWMNGQIDEVRIYNRVLSETEVRQLYLQGK